MGSVSSKHCNIRLASRYPNVAKAQRKSKNHTRPRSQRIIKDRTREEKEHFTYLPNKHPHRHSKQHPPHLPLLPPQSIQTPPHHPLRSRNTLPRPAPLPRKWPRHILRGRKPTAPQRFLDRANALRILRVEHPLPLLAQPAVRSAQVRARERCQHSLVD